MGLEEYRRKRDFRRTPEPSGEGGPRQGPGRIYVIQRHHASHLHYDLRLEKDGVLKSWAIPKEPPDRPGVRRLAVQTEDHPIEYADFEGIIPEGMYGAGKVEIWDRGTYEPIEEGEGKWTFRINGERLKGEYCLIKFRAEAGDKNWLFFKKKG